MKNPRVALVVPDRDLPRDQLVSLLDQIRAEISASVASLRVNYRLPWTRPEKELLGRAASELEEFLDYTLEGLQTVVAGAVDEGEAAYRARRAADRKAATVDFVEEVNRVKGVLEGAVKRLQSAARDLPPSAVVAAEGALDALRDAAAQLDRSADLLRDAVDEEVGVGFYGDRALQSYAYAYAAAGGYVSLLSSQTDTLEGRAETNTVESSWLVKNGWKPVRSSAVPAAWLQWFEREDRWGLVRKASGRTAAMAKNTVTVYEIIHDIARPGPNADYTDIRRTRDKSEAERFAANHTHLGRPCQVQVAEVPKRIVERWGI